MVSRIEGDEPAAHRKLNSAPLAHNSAMVASGSSTMYLIAFAWVRCPLAPLLSRRPMRLNKCATPPKTDERPRRIGHNKTPGRWNGDVPGRCHVSIGTSQD